MNAKQILTNILNSNSGFKVGDRVRLKTGYISFSRNATLTGGALGTITGASSDRFGCARWLVDFNLMNWEIYETDLERL